MNPIKYETFDSHHPPRTTNAQPPWVEEIRCQKTVHKESLRKNVYRCILKVQSFLQIEWVDELSLKMYHIGLFPSLSGSENGIKQVIYVKCRR